MAITDRLGATVDATEAPSSSTPNAGLAWKTAVRAATTGSNIVLIGLQTIDGIALNAGDRVLVKDQTDQTTNGIYNASTGAWAASSDFQNNTLIASGVQVHVNLGTINGSGIWALTTPDPINLGTSDLTFSSSLLRLAIGGPTLTYARLAVAGTDSDPSLTYNGAVLAAFNGTTNATSLVIGVGLTNPYPAWIQARNWLGNATAELALNPAGGFVTIAGNSGVMAAGGSGLSVGANWSGTSTYSPPGGSGFGVFAVSVFGEAAGIQSVARTLNAAGNAALASAHYAFADSTAVGNIAWGQYIEAHSLTAESGAYGIELATVNRYSGVNALNARTVPGGPYNFGIQIDAGNSEPSTDYLQYSVSAAISITKNGGSGQTNLGGFGSGIVVRTGALDSTIYSPPEAISLSGGSDNYAISWWSSGTNRAWYISSNATSGNNSLVLENSTIVSSASIAAQVASGPVYTQTLSGTVDMRMQANSSSALGAIGTIGNNSWQLLVDNAAVGTVSATGVTLVVPGTISVTGGGTAATWALTNSTNTRTATVGILDGFNGGINQSAGNIYFQLGGLTIAALSSTTPGVLTLGLAGTYAGELAFANTTSGTITLEPPTGALGSAVLTLPDVTDTLTANAATQTLTNKTIAFSSNTLTGVAPLASPIFTTSITAPLIIGGTGTTSTQLTFQTTTGIGTTDGFKFVGGNNGATTFGTWNSTSLTVNSTQLNVGPNVGGALASVVGVLANNASGNSYLFCGQDSSHGILFSWLYNATAASASATLQTYGNSNQLSIDASQLNLQTSSGGGLNVGQTTTVATFNGTTASSSKTTGALTIAGGLGVAGAGYFGGTLGVPGGATAIFTSTAAITSTGASSSPTLGTAGPAGATTPTKWIPINDNGTTRSFPVW